MPGCCGDPAPPDFSTSAVAVEPGAPREGDVVRYEVTLRNTGGTDSRAPQLRVTLPLEGMFVDLAGLEGARVDPAGKSIEASLALPAGRELRFAFRVVTPRDSGGRMLSPRIALQDFQSGASYMDGVSTVIGTRLPSGGLVLGGTRVTPAGLVVLGFLLAVPLLWLLVRGRSGAGRPRRAPGLLARGTGPLGAVLATVLALGFWTIFGSMALRDWRALSWPETVCTVLDRKLRVVATTSGSGRSPAPTPHFEKLLALRYRAGGVDTISTGFDTGSRLGIGGAAGAREDLERWAVGARVPCWFDPGNPGDVVVVRGFGGAYLFALIPLPVFLLGTWLLRSQLRGRRTD